MYGQVLSIQDFYVSDFFVEYQHPACLSVTAQEFKVANASSFSFFMASEPDIHHSVCDSQSLSQLLSVIAMLGR